MKNVLKKSLSILIAAIMLLCTIPFASIPAFAEEETVPVYYCFEKLTDLHSVNEGDIILFITGEVSPANAVISLPEGSATLIYLGSGVPTVEMANKYVNTPYDFLLESSYYNYEPAKALGYVAVDKSGADFDSCPLGAIGYNDKSEDYGYDYTGKWWYACNGGGVGIGMTKPADLYICKKTDITADNITLSVNKTFTSADIVTKDDLTVNANIDGVDFLIPEYTIADGTIDPNNGDKEIAIKFGSVVLNKTVDVKEVKKGEIKNTTPDTNSNKAVLTNSIDDLKRAVPFTDKELADINNGKGAKIWLEVKDITSTVTETDKKLIDGKLNSNSKIGMYFDASMFKQIGSSETVKLTELNNEITISLTVPDNLINKDKNINRSFGVIRLHDGKAEETDSVFDSKNKKLKFNTGKFSTYAIVYTDNTITNVSSPKTGDNNIALWTLLMFVSSAGFTGIFVYSRKNRGIC